MLCVKVLLSLSRVRPRKRGSNGGASRSWARSVPPVEFGGTDRLSSPGGLEYAELVVRDTGVVIDRGNEVGLVPAWGDVKVDDPAQ